MFELDDPAAASVLGAMSAVAAATGPLRPADRTALAAAATIVLGRSECPDLDAVVHPTPEQLAIAVPSDGPRRMTVGLLVVMATVDGTLSSAATDTVAGYASALDVQEPAVDDLTDLATNHVRRARADMLRRNRESITGHWSNADTYDRWIMPYRTSPDPELEARYDALGSLDEGTFGRTFHSFYAEHGFTFPGHPDAANEQFTTPHDSTHVLSGYDTSVQGELLVSTFTGGMHHEQALAGHILPVITSWHLGIPLAEFAGSTTGALDPRKFFVAWDRGAQVHGDTFRAPFDFWATVASPLEQVRERMQVPALRPADAADGVVPDWYRPSA